MKRLVVTLAGVAVLLGATPAFSVSKPADGFRIGQLNIPKLGVSTPILEGTRAAQLNRGVGHYKISKMPGSGKVVAIAGHRTTYHRPFYNLNLLKRGDTITIKMWYGKVYRYKVTGTRVVAWNDWTVLRGWGAEKLVLTACHPRGSASHRIVAFAKRV